jgi:hypothetical protein
MERFWLIEWSKACCCLRYLEGWLVGVFSEGVTAKGAAIRGSDCRARTLALRNVQDSIDPPWRLGIPLDFLSHLAGDH